MDPMTYDRDGAEHFPGAAALMLGDIERQLADLPREKAGIRLSGRPELRELLDRAGPIGAVAAARLGQGTRPVRAILFDKNPSVNWGLAWHQDRTICVRERVETPGFGPWTRKSGLPHVVPPVSLLEAMVTIRIHLDPVPLTNAPLLVAPGSHRFGRIDEDDIEAVVRSCGIRACTAARGDVWLYATLILHASEPARVGGRRRVLQVDYTGVDLPGALDWLGI